MEHPHKIKFVKTSKKPLTKDEFLSMVKSLGNFTPLTRRKENEGDESHRSKLKKSYSIHMHSTLNKLGFSKLNVNTEQPIDYFDCGDSTSSTTPSVSSTTLQTPTKDSLLLSTDRTNFIFKKKKISHIPSKSSTFNTISSSTERKTISSYSSDVELNIEDLIMIEDNFNKIKINIARRQSNFVHKACFNWWNFYFHCCVGGRIEKYFSDSQTKKTVNLANLYILLGMLISYDIAFDHDIFMKNKSVIMNLISINYCNFLSICESLLNKIKEEYLNSFWVEKFKSILAKNYKEKNGINKNINFTDKLNFYTNCAGEYIKILLINKRQPTIQKIFSNLKAYTPTEINYIFLTEIIHIANENGSVPFCKLKAPPTKRERDRSLVRSYSTLSEPMLTKSISTQSTKSLLSQQEQSKILKTPRKKKNLTLVLDLDETLMCFIVSDRDPNQGFSRLRPYLYEFLDTVIQYYELIVFTAATQDYADPILDAMESNKAYFDRRLYRESCVVMGGDYVKDISNLGRGIQSVIIVDNMQQNYKLQKQNGILISSFWGDDGEDRALFELGIILTKIAEEFNENPNKKDVRALLQKYREDIVRNVSCK